MESLLAMECHAYLIVVSDRYLGLIKISKDGDAILRNMGENRTQRFYPHFIKEGFAPLSN